MGMALDEPKDDDQVFEESGVTYVINKDLLEQVKPVNVDFVESPRGSGYRITANIAKSCGSCSC